MVVVVVEDGSQCKGRHNIGFGILQKVIHIPLQVGQAVVVAAEVVVVVDGRGCQCQAVVVMVVVVAEVVEEE